MLFRKYFSFCTWSAARGIKQSNQSRSFRFADRNDMNSPDIKEVVKQKYGQAALRVSSGGSSCCGAIPSCGCDPITANLYDSVQAGQIPEEALLASLGCGNPTALAKLNPGETVLDLGS